MSKRFKVPFRTHVPMDKTVASQTWNVLANAIDEIYNRNASQLSFEELYRNAYNLVLHKHGTLLYEGVTEKFNFHLTATAERLSNVSDSSLLEEMSTSWAEHQITMIMVRDILMYMDRTYIQQQRRRPVYLLGVHLYRLTVWEHPKVKERAIELLMTSVRSERNGLLTDDRSILKQVLSMLLELGQSDGSNVYESDFETPFLAQTQDFYRVESQGYLSQNSATDYVAKATKRLEEEKDRSTALGLPLTTETPMQSIIETELVERHARTLVDMENSGFAFMLKDDTKLSELREMYTLFARVPTSVDNLREALAERIKADGKALITDQEKGVADPSAFVRGVLAMRDRYDKIVEFSFRGEKKARKRMRESFEDFLNIDARAASCLSVYVDEQLRVGLRGASQEKIAQEINKIIVVFRYLSDKDVFESFYKQHLAKRLLMGRSVSDDVEKAMVSELKRECGYQFTSKLEGMFNDIRVSRDMQELYKNYKRNQSLEQESDGAASGKPIDIEVDVLTNGYWPSQNIPACILPKQVQDAIDRYTKFYLGKHTGRKLSWQTSAGSAELKATFGSDPKKLRRHELGVSTYQMCILLLFNDTNSLTLGQIRSKTHVPDAELRRHLVSLCTPKHRVLRKGSRGRGITSDDDTFTFNPEYMCKLKRVRIPLVKETSVSKGAGDGANSGAPGSGNSSAAAAAANGAVPVKVEEERRHLVEAAIVRIMKARKSLGHNDLFTEVTRQVSVRFTPSPQFVKKRIEGLIERDYLERSEHDHRVYSYLA
mmetsp:Transcript_20917/g.49317  ORF Transcript_20917/g.49317 Transcript_20917/m.49317 type:complete len:772 (+) Transcript_20917:258-2573(+)